VWEHFSGSKTDMESSLFVPIKESPHV